jgi:hypothetical protein
MAPLSQVVATGQTDIQPTYTNLNPSTGGAMWAAAVGTIHGLSTSDAAPSSLALYDTTAPAGALTSAVQLVPMENPDGTPALDQDGQQGYILRRVVP